MNYSTLRGLKKKKNRGFRAQTLLEYKIVYKYRRLSRSNLAQKVSKKRVDTKYLHTKIHIFPSR